jgi:hypothetical protein
MQKLQYVQKKVSGTKMINFDNCEMFREKRRSESRGVYQRRIWLLHSSYRGVVVSYVGVGFCTTGVERRLKINAQSHGMR